MKRLPIVIIGVGLLAAACSAAPAGSLGNAPAGASRPSASASSATPTATSPGGQQTTQPAREISLQVWFTRDGKLFSTERTIPATLGVGQAALDRLLAGPAAAETAAGLSSQIPPGTSLRGLSISSGTATVDLSSAFASSASSSAMALRIAQAVYTLTQFPQVTGVRFELNGQGVTSIGGVPVQAAQTRVMYASYLPAITVQSPVIGEQVTSPVTVSGTADVFEAVVSLRVLDQAGNELARTFTNATCGTGCRGSYAVTISYSVAQSEPGTIEVFETSAKDGSPVNVQLIPVTLTP
jgi:Immunoglobulin-like domain of bacterial spore germination/Sporulation and spore germination